MHSWIFSEIEVSEKLCHSQSQIPDGGFNTRSDVVSQNSQFISKGSTVYE